MSHNEGEHASFTLPSAEFTPMRQAFQAADQARKEEVFAHTQACWKQMTRKEQADESAYGSAVQRYLDQHLSRHATKRDWHGREITVTKRDELYSEVGDELLAARLPRPHRVLVSDMDYPTNRTTRFVDENHGVAVSFDRDKNKVTFDVEYGDHAVEESANHWLRRLLFKQVGAIGWTRGTGGVLSRSDETEIPVASYDDAGNECEDYEITETEHVVEGFGYIGLEQCPRVTGDFRDSKGRLVRITDELARAESELAKQRRAEARGKTSAKSTAGSFKAARRSEVPVAL